MKRWTFTILLFLLLVSGGAIVNVAVAWGCALSVDVFQGSDRYGMVAGSDWWWGFHRHTRHGGTYLFSWRRADGDTPVTRGFSPEAVVPNWTGFATPTPMFYWCLERYGSADDMRIADARGWPVLSMWAQWEGLPNEGSGHRIAVKDHEGNLAYEDFERPIVNGGIATSLPWWRPEGAPRVIPLYPIWSGFLFNTLFYAVILWLLIPGPFVLRRHVRMKRGVCPKCGYDLRGAPSGGGCPECGWNRQPEAIT